ASKWCVGRPEARVVWNRLALGEVGLPASTSVSVYQVSNTGHPSDSGVMAVMPCHSAHPCSRMEVWSSLLTQPLTVSAVTGKLPGEVRGSVGRSMCCGFNGGLDWAEATVTKGKQVKIRSSSMPLPVAEIFCLIVWTVSLRRL